MVDMATSMAQIVDLNRYPVDKPDTSMASELLEKCRNESAMTGLCMLPGFVHPKIIATMTREAESLIDNASRFDIGRTAYIEPIDSSLPNDHPRRVKHPTKYHQVLNYQIPNNSMLRQLFYWQPLTDFLGRAMGYEKFYRCDCPHLALTIKIAGQGDTDGWHYDSNEAVFSILLQDAEEGGEFELLPNIRQNGEENYDIVTAAFDDPKPYSIRHKIKPGTLVMFKGRTSLHRVTPVQGLKRRIIALLSYHTAPGHTNSQGYISLVHSQMPVPGIADAVNKYQVD